MKQNPVAEFAVKVLKEYARDIMPVRSTSDLSPLEEYLLERLYQENERFKRAMRFVNERRNSKHLPKENNS